MDKIYISSSECFCEKIIPNTFHVTLHDLSNSYVLHEISTETFENELKVVEISKKIINQKIKMKSKYIFNMVNTSLVLGLYPSDETEYNKLAELYNLFDNVKGTPLSLYASHYFSVL